MDSSYHCFTLKVPATPSFLENNISQKKKKNGHTACSKGCVALQANFYFGLKKSAGKSNYFRPETKIDWVYTVALQQVKMQASITREVWAMKLCSVTTLAIRPNRVAVTQIFFFRCSQQAKLGVCCPGPERRNTTHFLAFDGRSKERENLACPYCSFELHAI